MIRQKISFNPNNFIDVSDATSFKLKWYVEDKASVSVGSPIVMLTIGGNKRQTYVIRSKFNGICRVLDSNEYAMSFPCESLGYVVDDEMDFIYPYELDKCTDPFTNEPILEWKQISDIKTTVGIPLTLKNIDAFYISNCFKNSKIFLVFNFATEYVKVKKGDTISLKFSNGDILDFTLESKPAKNVSDIILPEDNENYFSYVIDEDLFENIPFYSQKNIGKKRASIRKNEFVLSHKDFSIFLYETLSMVRITFNSEGGTYIDLNIQSRIMNKSECPMIIKSMFVKLAEKISLFDSSYSLESLQDIKDKTLCSTVQHDPCFVYLMYDEANGFYKIGMSNNPVYREGTLQSEKPTIKLIASHKYPTRKFAFAVEAALHNLYSNLHVRGEWYRLSKDDVNVIIEGLK